MARKVAVLVAMLACACAHAPEKKAVAPVGPVAPAPKAAEVPAPALYKEARELIAQGSYEAARVKLDAFLAREPKSAAANFDAGWVAEKLGDPAAAAAHYRRALSAEPEHAGAALNLVRLLRAQDKAGEALPVVRAALAKREDDPALLNALSALLRSEKKLDEAEAAARRVLLRHPKDADAYRNLAGVEADRGHVRLAESALQNARKLDDKDAGILNSLGLLAMRRDDVAAGRAYFAQATQLDPNLGAAWANLGAIALSYRDYAAAEDAYGKAVALDGARWDTHLAHGWSLEGLKKIKDARAEYEKVLALKPAQEDALYGKALALKTEGDLPAAMEAFKAYAALPKASKVKEAQGQIASIDLRLKNPPAAAGGPKPASGAVAARPAGDLDLSKLPQGATADQGPGAEALPSESEGAMAPDETPAEKADPKAPAVAPAGKTPAATPAAGKGDGAPPAAKDGGVQNGKPANTVHAQAGQR